MHNLPEAVRVVSQAQMIHDRASAHSTQSLVHINCLEPHEARKMFDELAAGLFKFIPAEAINHSFRLTR